MWVPPFGYRRINSCLQIPGAFRSLPRPSSLLEAKASSVRSSSLSRTYKWINFATFLVSSFFTRFAYEIAVLFATRKNSNLLIRLNLFFFFTSLSLSVLSMIFGSLFAAEWCCYFQKRLPESTRPRSFNLFVPWLNREPCVNNLAPKRRCSSHTFRYGYLVTT